MSHELRTPLNAILGYKRLLRSGIITGEKAVQGLETLERNATALTQIVEDVLDVSRIVSGKVRLNVQAVDVPLVLHHSVATILPAADAKGVRVQTIADPRVGPVAGDPDPSVRSLTARSQASNILKVCCPDIQRPLKVRCRFVAHTARGDADALPGGF